MGRMRTHVRFCTSGDGVRLAYAISGKGPPLVRAPHWFTHLEYDWTNPAMRPWVEDLSRGYSLVRFDQRGTGLSSREVPEISFEAQARPRSGHRRGGLRALRAARAVAGRGERDRLCRAPPERVSHLILHGGFVRGWAKRIEDPEGLEKRRTQVKLIELGWGSDDPSFRQVFSTQFMPAAPVEAIRAFNDFMPLTSSPKTAAAIFEKNGLIDVQEEARRVRCPTLVVHGRGDLRIPIEEGRRAASLIPGALPDARNAQPPHDAGRASVARIPGRRGRVLSPAAAAAPADAFPRSPRASAMCWS